LERDKNSAKGSEGGKEKKSTETNVRSGHVTPLGGTLGVTKKKKKKKKKLGGLEKKRVTRKAKRKSGNL